ncbi:PREDICTED: uncharacterized protein C14orf105 homolog isoform X2 [Sturnus vulgaris]|uniref:uncharacterized protein C14orf105 homolog isoform X2 n=1 Tax=Sturnus vulgaris TaxID=9172 RepID=UPI00071A428B|nr:PREDICTED: uncharacterized protein C14orf105 homolog isoform X2 [Sturnus vulgaris]
MRGFPSPPRALALRDGSELLQGAPQGDQGGPSAGPGGCGHSECPAGAPQRARTAQPTPPSAHLPPGASTSAGDLVRESLCRAPLSEHLARKGRDQHHQAAPTPKAPEPWSQREVAASPKPKVLEKRGQSLNALPGRRQHLHKLQMLDLTRKRREAELERNLHREAKINEQKIKEFSPKDVLDTPQRGDSARSPDPVPAEHNQHFPEDDPGNTWGGGLCRQPGRAELSPGRKGKVDLWFCREPRTRDVFWDSSSTGSEEGEREEKIHRKPTLVRTRTERISLFDDFFDRDF